MTLLGMAPSAGPVPAFTIIGLQTGRPYGSWATGDHRRDLRRLRGDASYHLPPTTTAAARPSASCNGTRQTPRG